MRFFLGSGKDEQDGQDGSSDDEEEGDKNDKNYALKFRKQLKFSIFRTLKEVLQQFKHSKKTRKRKKELDQAKKSICQEKKSKREKSARLCNLEAIRSIYDPQRFADRLFSQLGGRRKNEKYAIRFVCHFSIKFIF